jgi:hypothetical protein
MTRSDLEDRLSVAAPGELTGRIPQQWRGPASAGRGLSGRPLWRPGFVAFPLVFAGYLTVSLTGWTGRPNASIIGWIVTIAWVLPVGNALLGLSGTFVTRAGIRRSVEAAADVPVVDDLLIVTVPTVARADTLPALTRSVRSFREHLPVTFSRLRVDLVIEEGCPEAAAVARLADSSDLIRVLTVPSGYRTPRGTLFKARANHYALTRRIVDGEAGDNVWILHMDDDTGVGPDSAASLARFINAQRTAGAKARHLAQGVLSYPREHATNRLLWLADSMRPGCDGGMFAATTGRGMPWAGLHGELLLIRSSVEAEIGWDFGPHAIVEDSEFGVRFCGRYPGGSEWFPGLCYGASPATLKDFIRQRARWSWGMLYLAGNRSIPARDRLLLAYNLGLWLVGPIIQVAFFLLPFVPGANFSASPVTVALLPVCALNAAYAFWIYWEGLKVNAAASSRRGRRLWEAVCLVPLIPLFTLFEAAGAFRGVVRFVRNSAPAFAVIAKPR